MNRDKIIGFCLLGLVVFMFINQSKTRRQQGPVAQTAETAAALPEIPVSGCVSALPAGDLAPIFSSGATILSNRFVSYSFINRLGELCGVELAKTELVKQPYVCLDCESADGEVPGRICDYGKLNGAGLTFGLAELAPFSDSLTYTGSWGQALLVTKSYSINPSNYLLRLRYTFKNTQKEDLPAARMRIWMGTIEKLGEAKERPPVRALTACYLNENGDEKIKRFNPGKEVKALDEKIVYGAIANRYFVNVLTPKAPACRLETMCRADKKANWLSGLMSFDVPSIAPGQEYVWEGTVYAGPKEYHTLQKLGDAMGVRWDYSSILDLGWYSIIAKWMLEYGLKLTYRYVGSYGVSIIILTIIIKLLLWPLTTKSTLAMKKMQKLQPEMKAIQAKYKDDPKKQQEEMMLLYRKYGYNPMGGCLPMLIQLPIFVALYQALSNAIELHGTSFLWINDLSMPDKVCTIFSFPIHPLAIAMGLGMVAQQMLTPKMGDPAQQKMMYIMPVIFTALFYNMPSGLVLYWFVNQILTMAQTTYLQYRKD